MKHIVVTGTTSGIGYETAKEILLRGDHLITINRSVEKMERCMEEWKKETPKAQISAYYADMSSMKQVEQVCLAILQKNPQIDVLLNNAGIYLGQKEYTEQGWEKTFAVNHMGYFAIAKGLLPGLLKSDAARIVNVASRAHHYGYLDLATVLDPPKYNAQRVYGTSKLCNILFTNHLAKELSEKGITVNCLHPGVVRTGFANNQGGLMGWGFRLLSRWFIGPKEGAQTSIFLIYDQSVAHKTGGYYAKCVEEKRSRMAQDTELAVQLWNKSMELLHQSWEM